MQACRSSQEAAQIRLNSDTGFGSFFGSMFGASSSAPSDGRLLATRSIVVYQESTMRPGSQNVKVDELRRGDVCYIHRERLENDGTRRALIGLSISGKAMGWVTVSKNGDDWLVTPDAFVSQPNQGERTKRAEALPFTWHSL